jgi:hypothetical protein
MTPSETVAGQTTDVRTYYDRPVLKEPVWRWYIPAYFFFGGLAGASSMMALAATIVGNRDLARRARLAALVSVATGTGFLVADLGRPSRFYNMLRVAKVTSPMSVGSWLLAGYGPATAVAAASDMFGVASGVGLAADAVAGVLGAGVATYTGVLVADTAIPAWHEARRELPFLFASGAAASAGAIGAALSSDDSALPARRLAVTAAIAELVLAEELSRRLGEVGEPYRQGRAGRLAKAEKAVTGVGVVLLGPLGRRRGPRVAGGALIAAGALLGRFAVWQAGHQSAKEPKYVIGPQRRTSEGGTGDGPASDGRATGAARTDVGARDSRR